MKYVQMFDLFGVTYKQNIHPEVQLQKSVFGGLLSIIVSVVSFVYFIYVIDQWRTSNLLPKYSNSLKAEKYSSIQFSNENLFEICYWKYSNEAIDPFRSTDNILMPIGFYILSGIPQEPFSLLSNAQELSTYQSKLVYVENLNIIQNSEFNPRLNETQELLIIITKCQKQLLKENQTCASDMEINNFFTQQTNILSFFINIKQFNPKTKIFDIIKKQFYIPFEAVRAQQIQLILKQEKATVDTGILFENFEEQKFIFDAQFIMSTISLNFFTQFTKMDAFLIFTIRLDQFSYETLIVYPKLGEILAQVGSVVSMIMLVKYVAFFYNEHLLQNCVVEAVLKNLILNYDSLKKSQEHKNKNTLKKLQSFAKQKLVFTNVINELSRIELYLLSLSNSTQINKIAQTKFLIKNEYKQESLDGIFSLNSNTVRENILNDEEFQDLFKAFFINPPDEKKIMNIEFIQ